ncbi:MAG: hypothetical protein PHS82_03215 [Lachnospiraceae bacterium]|nr:hypothetical protein [Lachnospiraceae bacterium]
MKKAKKSLKNTILKTITAIDALVCVYYACWLDADSWTPLVIVSVTMGWLILFGIANNWFDDNDFREDADK